MSDKPLNGKKIAILVADGFEQVELTEPRKALDAAGADTSIVSLKPGQVRAWKFTEWGEQFPVDMVVERADPAAFDALLLPGGVINPDVLRMCRKRWRSCGISSTRTSRSPRSATAPGRSSRSARRAAGA